MSSEDAPNLFDHAAMRDPRFVPLAERMRPQVLEDVVGQTHLLGPDGLLRRAVEACRLPSMILWGPPGTGKTTLARIVATSVGASFEPFSATQAGVKDLRGVMARARQRRRDSGRMTVLFVDEIHRFHKGQQDSLLPHVEAGVCTLVGATTENPSFEINAALLSRCRVLQLNEIEEAHLVCLLRRALTDPESGLGKRRIETADTVLFAIARTAQGDARRALRTLELAVDVMPKGETELDARQVHAVLERPDLRHDKAGEAHYNVVSALIKSMRASDPDAAVYWVARMLEAGEDPMYVARRLVIFASEDVGNADPQALSVAASAAQAVHLVGLPEAVLPLTQAALYLSLAPKSNSSLRAYAAARKSVREYGALPVPLEVRNAVTDMMKAAQYGRGYRYPHDFSNSVAPRHESYLPSMLRAKHREDPLFKPGNLGWEARAQADLTERRRASHAVPCDEEGPGPDVDAAVPAVADGTLLVSGNASSDGVGRD